jgi:hypothetical protein
MELHGFLVCIMPIQRAVEWHYSTFDVLAASMNNNAQADFATTS